MSQHVPIRVAISGGGMAGAALMHALHQEPNLDVHIFESASTFKEIGAAVGVLRNAKRALELIGPSAAQCLPRAGAVPMKAAHYMLARGPDSGEMVARIDSHGGDLNDNVHRAAFLRELLADVPPSQMHASKKLDTISRASDGSVVMHFADNTTHECDIVIGADGIHSRVRQLILGHDNPVASPVPAGWWFLQLLKPYKEVQALLGEELVDINNHVEYCYPGDGVFLLHNILSEGDLCQVAAVVKCDKDEAVGQWKKEVASKELLKHFSAFPPRHENAMKELLRDTPTLTAFYMWEHLHADTYVDGPICIMGDAAHSTTPFQASGAGMSLEDALILSSLLKRAKSPTEAHTALQVYDQVRRPRTQQVVDSSRETGYIFTGPSSNFDLDSAEAMKANLPQRWDFIMDFDVERHVEIALQTMDEELLKSKVA